MFERLVLLILFLLPWQTRYIFDDGVTSIYTVELLILVTFFFGLRLHIRKEHQIPARWLGFVLLASLVSVVFAINRELSFFLWLHLLFAALFFLLLLDQRVQPLRVLHTFCLGLLIPIGIGIYQVLTGDAFSSSWFGLAEHDVNMLGTSVIEGTASRWLRAYGTFDHPNVFGGYVATALFCILALLSRQSRRPRHYKIIFLSLLSIFSFALGCQMS